MPKEEEIKVGEWGGHAEPTDEQKKRKAKTGSYYKRDTKVGEYKFSKGKFI